uniref:Uncharacterized protein n=1 Tax=Callorhinchus milii TaxID=7868 RepID=A0A4W3H607_CALMI|eukprot:gi/632980252/ref/XP_007906931.1/ PREDICTED: UPF0500 protein C1orf216 homolog isoform X1 [Callorhinchus milii]
MLINLTIQTRLWGEDLRRENNSTAKKQSTPSFQPCFTKAVSMLTVQHVKPREVPSSPVFSDGKVNAQMRNKATGGAELKQDKNFNFVEESCDKNENVGQCQAGGTALREMVSQLDNGVQAKCEPDVQLGRDAACFVAAADSPGLESGRLKPLSVENVRMAPGVTGTGHGNKPNAAKDYEEFAVSPSDDNGYSSSCLSIESPDSVDGSIWEVAETVQRDDFTAWQQNEDVSVEKVPGSLTASGSFLPLLLEAVQNLQEKQRFKEQEREKHQTQVIMYRRLALLRWIRNLQQKVVDHQSRLQESYDTILSNRKELLKFIKQGVI